ncbi:primary-amine oxidase [Glutamicibacter halophytocola]|uniref:primary-amine oxidase n=1 Tax=Glutamicibacter halophytocola TaxID=1933880 RepID=UPI00155910F9|nr:primary-amine oxidase [Glutamicibacter halophytocola]NQD41083.1 primary-amine oxidase [Glutamicibacter halophytocola]
MEHLHPTTALETAHPLEQITSEEILRTRHILADAGLVEQTTRFAYLGLLDPPKDLLYADAGTEIPRKVRVMLYDPAIPRSLDITICLASAEIESQREIEAATEGQVPVLLEEFDTVEEILANDEGWIKALASRGLSTSQVRVAPLSAGVFDYKNEEGKRLLRGLGFVQNSPEDHAWAHPIDRLVAFVDLENRCVDRLIDDGPVPVPDINGNYTDPQVHGELRDDLKAIEITQPDGASFTVDGNHLSWLGWDLRVGFDSREGLVLHQIHHTQGGTRRPLIHRASISEMVVPYGDPSPYRSWQNYFDTGEYLVGRDANSLKLGCDCLGEIHYMSPVVADDFGNPRVIDNGICIHEEDAGIGWKHTDEWAGSNEVRRNRRLVVSFFTTVGNYDYGFYWYLYLDGTIEFEAKATGIVFTAALPHKGYEYASEIAPGLAAPFHQHLFGARLDMMIDGHANAVDELEVVRLPKSEGNPHGNAFTQSRLRLGTEQQAVRDANAAAGRVWQVSNPGSLNHVGEPVGYTLYPQNNPTLAMADDSSIAARAAFTRHDLWVTRFAEGELYAAGDFVNRNPGGAGLPAFVEADRDIDGQDIVLWHSFGLTHFPRPEDWPIMPVDTVGFTLKPHGFFNENPMLNIPASTSSHCSMQAPETEGHCGA